MPNQIKRPAVNPGAPLYQKACCSRHVFKPNILKARHPVGFNFNQHGRANSAKERDRALDWESRPLVFILPLMCCVTLGKSLYISVPLLLLPLCLVLLDWKRFGPKTVSYYAFCTVPSTMRHWPLGITVMWIITILWAIWCHLFLSTTPCWIEWWVMLKKRVCYGPMVGQYSFKSYISFLLKTKPSQFLWLQLV